MRLSERVLVFLATVYSVVLCDINNTKYKTGLKQKGRHLLTLLGYLHGYKIGQDYAVQIPPYIVTPIYIVPSLHQQQSVNIQTGSTDENYQENGGTIQTINPSKIILPNSGNITDEIEVLDVAKVNDDDTILQDEHDRNLKRNYTTEAENIAPNLRQNTLSENSSATLNNTKIKEVPSSNTINNTTVEEKNNTTPGLYPAANYENQMINYLSLTTDEPSTGDSQALPPVTDNRWQNFTSKGNSSNVMRDDNITMINENQNNTSSLSYSKENVTEHHNETYNKGPYPNAWYNNKAIDQLSITTNYYTNESPSSQNDRWGSYSPMNKMMLSSGFRPLAGLYYDGFLHRPLKKFGFIPGRNDYYARKK